MSPWKSVIIGASLTQIAISLIVYSRHLDDERARFGLTVFGSAGAASGEPMRGILRHLGDEPSFQKFHGIVVGQFDGTDHGAIFFDAQAAVDVVYGDGPFCRTYHIERGRLAQASLSSSSVGGSTG
jgi:hypothetical protein